MANSDYIVRGSGLITPVARLLGAIGPLAPTFPITGYQSQDGSLPAIGSAAFIENEIVSVVARSMTEITVARGVADTVPASHPLNAKIWFFSDKMGSDKREYLTGETIGVKVLMKTSGGAMEAKNAPANALTFNSRFARPYPPGKVLVNGNPFTTAISLTAAAPNAVITWAHRDRVTQGDVLVPHSASSIGPEPGTTYTVRVYDSGNVLKRTVSGITGTSYTYSLGNAVADLGLTIGFDIPGTGRFELESVRDGFVSLQHYEIGFTGNALGIAEGWGNAWGLGWGN